MSVNPTPIKNTLWQVLDSLNIKEELCASMILQQWEFVLGFSLAQQTKFVDYRNNILIVQIDHPQWKEEFIRNQRTIKSQFNSQLGNKLISTIHFLTPS